MFPQPKNVARQMRRRRENPRPSLRFSPPAWAKLLFLRDLGPTEVGGFGISRAADLLYIDDFMLIQQDCSPVTVAFDDGAVAEFFDQQIDVGHRPEQFARIWIHTHPGTSAEPSWVDEETFARVFGRSDWAIMAILARGGQSYARLQFHTGPGGSVRIPVTIDWSQPFEATDWNAWRQEYVDEVHTERLHRDLRLEEMGAVRGASGSVNEPEWLFFPERGTS